MAVTGIHLRDSDFKGGRIKYESIKRSKGMFELNLYEIFNQEGEIRGTLEW